MSGTNGLAVYEQALIGGDLAALSNEQRMGLYLKTCESVGLNPLTKPFEYLRLQGKTILYTKKDATEQLRKIHGVSLSLERIDIPGCVAFRATAVDKTGRKDEEVGAVACDNLKGDALANAVMKASTKAKRRVTLSICGLGFLDESELDTVKGAKPVRVTEDGEILADEPSAPKLPEASLEDQLRASVEANGKTPEEIASSLIDQARACQSIEELRAVWESPATRAEFAALTAPQKKGVRAVFDELKKGFGGANS